MYRIRVEVTENGETREWMNQETENVAILGGTDYGCVEALSGLNVVDLAQMIANSKNFKRAAKLAKVFEDMKKMERADAEENLLSKILGGEE